MKFSPTALNDLTIIKKNYSKATNNRLKSILENPFHGFGCPEALKYQLSGKWSRELTKKDRVIYSVKNDIIEVDSLLGHYKK